MLGAAEARAPTLTFLDAHCEATVGWLEPLMSQISLDRSAVPCPVIDSLSAHDFKYNGGANVGHNIGIFGWSFGFHW